jgi:hypothetical protein
MDKNYKKKLIRLRKISSLQNKKAQQSLDEWWVTEASLREYFYDIPRSPENIHQVLLNLNSE